jgi:hypothetical protein
MHMFLLNDLLRARLSCGRLIWLLAHPPFTVSKLDRRHTGRLRKERQHPKKSFLIFPSPAGLSLTKLYLGGNNDVIYKLFPPRESLVSDIPAWGREYLKAFFTAKLLTKEGRKGVGEEPNHTTARKHDPL